MDKKSKYLVLHQQPSSLIKNSSESSSIVSIVSVVDSSLSVIDGVGDEHLSVVTSMDFVSGTEGPGMKVVDLSSSSGGERGVQSGAGKSHCTATPVLFSIAPLSEI